MFYKTEELAWGDNGESEFLLGGIRDVEQIEVIRHHIFGFASHCGGKYQVVVRVAALSGAGTELCMTHCLPASDSFLQALNSHFRSSEPLKDFQILDDHLIAHDELEPATRAPKQENFTVGGIFLLAEVVGDQDVRVEDDRSPVFTRRHALFSSPGGIAGRSLQRRLPYGRSSVRRG